MTAAPESTPFVLNGPGVAIPHDMPELPDDVTIIARLIDANCRAHSEKYGYHLDSRCLSHYNEGIVRLAQAGVVDLVPVLDRDGNPVALYEDVTDAPAQAVRVRATYVPFEKMVSRPTSDPIWKLQAEEMARLRYELEQARNGTAPQAPTIPEWLATAPRTPQPDPASLPGGLPVIIPPTQQ